MSIYRCLMDIAAGMDYLHSMGILHGGQPTLLVSSGGPGTLCTLSGFKRHGPVISQCIAWWHGAEPDVLYSFEKGYQGVLTLKP